MQEQINKMVSAIKPTEDNNAFIKSVLDWLTPDNVNDLISSIFPSLTDHSGFLSRKEKAGLHIGQNYANTKYELNGCIDDAEDMQQIFNNKFDVNGKLLVDKQTRITKDILKRQLEALAVSTHKDVKTVVLTYSGHGSQLRADADDFEEDGLDECWIVFLNGKIVGFKDDDLRKYFLNKIADDTNVLIISDSCHSGSMADLTYTYNPKTKIVKDVKTGAKVKGNILQISGSKDEQVSLELKVKGKSTGALTYAICKTLRQGITAKQLVDECYKIIADLRLEQIPHLSTNKMDLIDVKL